MRFQPSAQSSGIETVYRGDLNHAHTLNSFRNSTSRVFCYLNSKINLFASDSEESIISSRGQGETPKSFPQEQGIPLVRNASGALFLISEMVV
jgi:hypothetical protein